MTDLQNESGSQQLSATGKGNADIYEDEINLADYLLVLWKRKYLILLGSLIPALIVGLALYFSPKSYKVTYVYDTGADIGGWNLTEHNYKTFLDQFYSAENTSRIRAKLPEYNPQMVMFEAWPPFMTFSEVGKKTPTQLEALSQMKAKLLYVFIVGRHRDSILKSASVIRENIEYVLPLYSVMLDITNSTKAYRMEMGKIERGKFKQKLKLRSEKAILAKLKNLETASPDKTADYPGWQIDVRAKAEYLPLEFQIQAEQLLIIRLEEQIKQDEEKYAYYKDTVSLNESLSEELKDNMSANHDYTIGKFRSFLIDLAGNCDDKPLKDYLSSYIKTIENRMSASAPVTENPEISSIAKGITKKSVIVFVVALMMSVFAGFLMEGIQQKRALPS